jgi:hypothetical protein
VSNQDAAALCAKFTSSPDAMEPLRTGKMQVPDAAALKEFWETMLDTAPPEIKGDVQLIYDTQVARFDGRADPSTIASRPYLDALQRFLVYVAAHCTSGAS